MNRFFPGLAPSIEISLMTPEGVVLDIEVASIARRTLAFSIDMMIMIGIAIVIFIVALIFSEFVDGIWGMAWFILAIFFIRNFYFIFFEFLWSGRTVGKRVAQIRVLDISGSPLKGNAIFLRNVTRDMELFLPIAAIFSPEMIWSGAPAWMGVIALSWVSLFAIFPFLNTRRARIGDLIGGTVVATNPKPNFLEDLAQKDLSSRFLFSPAQLDMYGVYELQTLESILHRDLDNIELKKIAEVIALKIGISQTKIDPPLPFLSALYAALRERHEKRLIFGDVQDRKKEGKYHEEETEITIDTRFL